MTSIAPDNIKKKSSFKIKFFKTIILKFFPKINKNLYQLLSIIEVAQLFTNGVGRSKNRRRANDSLTLTKTIYIH
jgi:hypothetical protein